jgi:hypothetical protein
MRRWIAFAAIVTSSWLVAAPGTATAGPPNAGCPKGFSLAPVSVLGDYQGVADNVNHDGWICLRDVGDFGIFVDNTVP